jgi:ATP-dependent RNA helicase DeaD
MSADPAAPQAPLSFLDLSLPEALLRALADVGYEAPSPIQAETIPLLLSGRDLLGQAQTGTGKTAAFALPALARIDLQRKEPQVLVLVPTRELALQVSEAFVRYAAHLDGFHVLPIYGGQSYQPQLNALKRGAHVVVGTPGRVIDHMNRGTLKLSALKILVLDEADEMLRMGFVDAVESILEQTPPERQIALFSATLPPPIRRIAQRHLKSPAEITIKSKTTTATNIRQRYWMVSGMHKLDALTRILEAEIFDGMLVFTRTKQATVELAEKLEARGFSAAPLNGDIAQAQRERTIARLKSGDIDILVATDVAARGLDVERIGHVVNYDVPYDTESYVHRIGRTGRAGRKGEAILFIAPRERNMLRAIERATRHSIEPLNLPTVDAVNTLRIAKFKQRILEALGQKDMPVFRGVLEQMLAEGEVPLIDLAAALACLAQGRASLLLAPRPESAAPREAAPERAPDERRGKAAFARMETYRVEVGGAHGIKPGNIVGAIANEAGIAGSHIGRVQIRDDHSLVDLPEGMPRHIFKKLQKVRAAGRELRISLVAPSEEKTMSKGMERKKEQKKKPARTLEEKRALKREKKANRG